MLKQIIIISDGNSNVGPNPAEVAGVALEHDIRVNTIGIIDNYENRESVLELESIAQRGGGICELTDLTSLSETLSRVTMQSVYGTIEEVVSKELNNIMKENLNEMNPDMRNIIIDMIDNIGDEVPLKCLILLDTSGSMKKKIEIGKKSILELLMFLEERSGENQIGVIAFPGRKRDYEFLCGFTDDYTKLRDYIRNIEIGGITPTGYAIEGAIKIFEGNDEEYLMSNSMI